MPIVVVSLIVQALAIVHVLRTGRDFRWIFLIVFLPVAGVIAYLLVEVLPSLNQNLTARRAVRRVHAALDPGRAVREAELEHERNPSVATASALADALTAAGRFDEAIRACENARVGIFEDDPKILASLANAQFGAGRYREAIATLDLLRSRNPSFRSPDAHLLYARAHEESGATDKALEEYRALASYYPGAEARVRQALLHKKLGLRAEAKRLFEGILRDARLAPKHFRKSQREWLDLARRELAEPEARREE